jgi:hypothetical protein
MTLSSTRIVFVAAKVVCLVVILALLYLSVPEKRPDSFK